MVALKLKLYFRRLTRLAVLMQSKAAD